MAKEAKPAKRVMPEVYEILAAPLKVTSSPQEPYLAGVLRPCVTSLTLGCGLCFLTLQLLETDAHLLDIASSDSYLALNCLQVLFKVGS